MFKRKASQKTLRDSQQRLELLDQYAGVGLWDAVIFNGDPMHKKSEWRWSSEFRRLLEFQNETDFPNAVNSWASLLHPDDVEMTFSSFMACLNDVTNETLYDCRYRLQTKTGNYRWFRAIAGVARNDDGVPTRACGTLIDIHDTIIAEQDKKKALEELAVSFQSSVVDSVETVASLSFEIETEANNLSDAISKAADKSSEVAKACEITSSNVQNVASASEELSCSISEIRERIDKAAQISKNAADETSRTNEMVVNLSKTVERINSFVSLINQIANQTNLLALNATIEAARAGDAGKGFAVVANEVKTLANQTGKATDEITQQIAAVQTETNHAVEAIRITQEIIHEMNDVSIEIASAVSQQGTAAQEISLNIQSVSKQTNVVSNNIQEVMEVVDFSRDVSSSVLDKVKQQEENSQKLNRDVEHFLAHALRH